MIRLYITVEGPTEETFVTEVLYQPLLDLGIWAIPQLAALNKRKLNPARGGWCSYEAVKNDITKRMKQYPGNDVRFTTMLDLYALPRDFPGFDAQGRYADPHQRVSWLEQQFRDDIDDRRFIPYLQLHEYEALLFADIGKLSHFYPGEADKIGELEAMCSQHPSPEYIDDGPDTAPSKRILAKIPRYDKVVGGSVTAIEIGLSTLRIKCPHFGEWLASLEALGTDISQSHSGHGQENNNAP